MKIKIGAFLTFRKFTGGQPSINVEFGGGDLMTLLESLCDQFGDEFREAVLDPETREIKPQIGLLLNGRHVSHLPDGLASQLTEGDEISIFPPIMGGEV